MFILSAFCLCLSDSMTSCLVVGLVLTLVRFSRRDVAIAKKGHDPRKRVLRTPLSISGLSSAWPATEIQEEWASPLGSEGRGSRQALTTVASPLRLRTLNASAARLMSPACRGSARSRHARGLPLPTSGRRYVRANSSRTALHGAEISGSGGSRNARCRTQPLPSQPSCPCDQRGQHNGHVSDGGARHWAIVASLVATAKLNGVEPLAWLTDVLERMVSGRTKAHELERLLPWAWKTERLEAAVHA